MTNKLITIVLLFATLAAFGQQATAPVTKTPEQIMKELREFDEKQTRQRIERYTGYFREGVSEFNKRTKERAELYKELETALADGDPMLIQKAVSNIHSNAYGIKLHVQSMRDTSKTLQLYIELAFESDVIDKARYLELRNIARSGIAEAEKKPPNEFNKLIEKAKMAIPNYFAMIERINERFK